MIKFPKIDQFRKVIRHVKTTHDFKGLDEDNEPIFRHDSPYPKQTYTGSVKCHGTNAGIHYDENNNITFQSRENEITVMKDNAGFAAFMSGISPEAKTVMLDIANEFKTVQIAKNFVFFGEFCGGNIQKGMAITGLPKMFVLFNFKVDDQWECPNFFKEELAILNANGIYSNLQFQTYELEIDFEQPELAQNKLGELTLAVEEECPVGKFFGVSGLGEGVVFKNKADLSSEFWFKVKGMKHSASKVKTLAPVDVEKVNSIREFVDLTVTESRLEQGISIMKERGKEIDRKNTGEFLKWVVTDIITEELDTLTENDLCAKDVGGAISNKARVFWFAETDKI